MSVASWLFRRKEIIGSPKLTDGTFWASWFGGSTWAGKPVTPTGALQVSAWWRCVKLYSEVCGSLPFKFYERRPNDERVVVRDHPVAIIVGQDPNADQTTQEFWGGQAASLAVGGNAYSEKLYLGSRLVGLKGMPFDTKPRRAGEGVEYTFDDRGRQEVLPADKVFHTRGWSMGGFMGMSPLAYARQSLSLTLATEEASGRTFAQGMRASGFFTGPKLNAEQRKDFKTTFIDPIVGNNAEAHYGILENGFDFKPVNINPHDAEMLLSRRFNVEEICRFMGVPPILAGHASEGQTMWGSGVENIILAWLTLGLDAFLCTLEKSVTKRLLTPVERTRFYAEFDRNALMRADSAARAEFIAKMIQNAQLTPNEGRKKDNLPPQPGGDELLVNSTLVPLRLAGQKPARVQPKPGEPIPEA